MDSIWIKIGTVADTSNVVYVFKEACFLTKLLVLFLFLSSLLLIYVIVCILYLMALCHNCGDGSVMCSSLQAEYVWYDSLNISC